MSPEMSWRMSARMRAPGDFDPRLKMPIEAGPVAVDGMEKMGAGLAS
jgi:hypothetical protein